MALTITRWDTTKNNQGLFEYAPDQVFFDSDILVQQLKRLPENIKWYYRDLNIWWIEWLANKAKKIIDASQTSEIFNKITSNLVFKDEINKARNSIRSTVSDWLDDMITIGWVSVKKAYLVMYFLIAVNVAKQYQPSTWVAQVNPVVQQTIAQTLWLGGDETSAVPKVKVVPWFTAQKTTVSEVVFPVANKENPSIIYPETGATVMDSTGKVSNILLPGIEKKGGMTYCAKTTREVQEIIYGYRKFIIQEWYWGDTDAIGYYLRPSTQDIDQLKQKYPLLNRIVEINKISSDKKLITNDKFDLLTDALIGPKELWILTTTQNKEGIKDGHMVAVNNMYNIDGTVEWVYVYDPYLSKSVHKWHKRLSDNRQTQYPLRKDDGYHMPINTYLAYCKYKGRVPLWVTIYNQPSTPTQLITNAKVSDDINIKQSDLKQFNDLYPQVVEYIDGNIDDFGDQFLKTTKEQDIANFAQESRLSPFAINRRWFQWIGQMNNVALKAVYDKYPFIKQKFNNKTQIKELNLEQMILASKLYKNGVIYSQICASTKHLWGKSIVSVINQDDAQNFVLAAYNRGSTRLAKILWEYIDKTNNSENVSREGFSEYYIKQIDEWKITNKWHEELFGCDRKNRFWYVDNISTLEELLRWTIDTQFIWAEEGGEVIG